MRKIFKSFDLNNSGTITVDELAAMLAKLGILADKKYIQAMMNKMDTNRSGMIELAEFINIVLYDPYK